MIREPMWRLKPGVSPVRNTGWPWIGTIGRNSPSICRRAPLPSSVLSFRPVASSDPYTCEASNQCVTRVGEYGCHH